MNEQPENVFEFVDTDKSAVTCSQCEKEITSSDTCVMAMRKCFGKCRLSFCNFDQSRIVFALNLIGFVAFLTEIFIDFLS